ncbi:MAG: hypothetical protein K1X79_02095 [Oligoflexia bacterium]|nr:hypothetical protein [Oligoflexia bacterium]
MKALRTALAAISLLALCGCQTMKPTEVGVRFRRLPPFALGGISSHVVSPGETTLVMPWDSIYRFDVSVKDISWGAHSVDSGGKVASDFVYTRALDGNEVALGVTIRYRVLPEADKLAKLISEGAVDDAAVRALIVAIGRADIRTSMNELETSKFLNDKSRYEAIDRARDSMRSRLQRYGIEIVGVALDGYRFERVLPDGTIDSSYQDKLTEIQKLREDTGREKSRIATIKAKKLQELNNAVAVVNRQVAEAQGFKKQATLRGDGYYQAKVNEALSIAAQGKAEVEGLLEQVNALAGPGGEALLRLELSKQLMSAGPRYFVVGEHSGNGAIDVKRTDYNDLIAQLGLIEANQVKASPNLSSAVKTGTDKVSGVDGDKKP